MIYNTLVQSHFNYGLMLWKYNLKRLEKLQKKAVRIIANSKYNAHTEPLFKSLNILKIKDTFNLKLLKLYHNYINNKLPSYIQSIDFSLQNQHTYNTRHRQVIHIIRHEFARKTLRYTLPKLLYNTPTIVTDKLYTHSIQGFSSYVKKYYISNYIVICSIPNCYICRNN